MKTNKPIISNGSDSGTGMAKPAGQAIDLADKGSVQGYLKAEISKSVEHLGPKKDLIVDQAFNAVVGYINDPAKERLVMALQSQEGLESLGRCMASCAEMQLYPNSLPSSPIHLIPRDTTIKVPTAGGALQEKTVLALSAQVTVSGWIQVFGEAGLLLECHPVNKNERLVFDAARPLGSKVLEHLAVPLDGDEKNKWDAITAGWYRITDRSDGRVVAEELVTRQQLQAAYSASHQKGQYDEFPVQYGFNVVARVAGKRHAPLHDRIGLAYAKSIESDAL